MADDKVREDMIEQWITAYRKHPDSVEKEIQGAATNNLGAGTGNVGTAFSAFVHCIAKDHTHLQPLQNELDAAIGRQFVSICIISMIGVIAPSRIVSSYCSAVQEPGPMHSRIPRQMSPTSSVRLPTGALLEPALGVINCCLPVLQPVLGKLMGFRMWNGQDDCKRKAASMGSTYDKAKIRDPEDIRPPAGRFKRVDDNGAYPWTTQATASYMESEGGEAYPNMFIGTSMLVSHDFIVAHEVKR